MIHDDGEYLRDPRPFDGHRVLVHRGITQPPQEAASATAGSGEGDGKGEGDAWPVGAPALDTDGSPLPAVDVSVSADSSRHAIGIHLITRNITIEVETGIEAAGVLRDMLDDVIGVVGGVSHLAEVHVLRESEALEVGLLKGRVAELERQRDEVLALCERRQDSELPGHPGVWTKDIRAIYGREA